MKRPCLRGVLAAALLLTCSLCARAAALPSVALFPASDANTACYRIPALLRLHDGTLLAFAEARRKSCSDFGFVEIVMRRSVDGGVSWSPQQVVASFGDLQAGNPVPVEDTSDPRHPRGRVFLFYNTGSASTADVRAGRGLREQWVRHSDDGGATWDQPVNITAQTARLSAPPYEHAEDWRALAMGPGHGLQTSSGRLFIAGNHSAGAPRADDTDYVAYAFYSDDHGETFHIVPDIAYPGSNESSAAQLGDGRIMMNSRDQTGWSRARIVSVTTEAEGNVFGVPYVDRALVDPVSQGSLLAAQLDGRAYLFFINPANPLLRIGLTLRASTDDGNTWPKALLLVPGGAGYSDIALLDRRHMGVLYEQGPWIRAARDVDGPFNRGPIRFMPVPLSPWLDP